MLEKKQQLLTCPHHRQLFYRFDVHSTFIYMHTDVQIFVKHNIQQPMASMLEVKDGYNIDTKEHAYAFT